MDERTYWRELEDALRGLYVVARLENQGGHNEFEAGQSNVATTNYRLDLKASIVQKITDEREESPENISEQLGQLQNRLEHELEFDITIGEYDESVGHLHISASYDRRDGGSL